MLLVKSVLSVLVLVSLGCIQAEASEIFTSLANVQQCYQHEQEFADLIEVNPRERVECEFMQP